MNIAEWLLQHTAELDEMLIRKAEEYGSYDLQLMGAVLAKISSSPNGLAISDAELGVLIYAVGKIARIVSGVVDGAAPNIDSWADLEAYAKMAQKIRQTGEW